MLSVVIALIVEEVIADSALRSDFIMSIFPAQVDVDGWGMMKSVLSVVIAPTGLGLLLNQFLPSVTELLKPVTPLVGVVLTSCLCAAPIAGISDVRKSSFSPCFGNMLRWLA